MKLTLVIITKDRPGNLRKCISALYKQTSKNFSLLIIDNHREQTAKPVYEYFKTLGVVPVKYIHEPVPGYSRARNYGLDNCSSKYLGFIDDDCIPCEQWVEMGLAAIGKFKSAYVIGFSDESGTDNLLTRVERHIYHNWCADYYDKQTYEINPKRLDTKNIILDMEIMNEYSIRFDERFNQYGGEDTDLGFQIKKAGHKGYFVKDMLLLHESRMNFAGFRKKSFTYGFNCYNLFHKWKPQNECINWDYYKNFRFFNGLDFIKDFIKIRESGPLTKIRIFCLLKIFNYFYLRGYFAKKKMITSYTHKV